MPVRQVTRIFGRFATLRYVADKEGNRWHCIGPYIDFVGSQKAPWQLSGEARLKEGLFMLPVTSFLYERGWRQQFNKFGCPGIETEFDEVTQFFEPVQGPDAVVADLSCGSGLMTRRLVFSNRYGRIIGGDLSAAMLREAARRLSRCRRPGSATTVDWVRLDVSRLPIATESVDAVHAGAALHCWVDLEASLSEVYRTLKPGGRFYASTFLLSDLMSGVASSFRCFTRDELAYLLEQAGFESVDVQTYGKACVIAKCIKSATPPPPEPTPSVENAMADDTDAGDSADATGAGHTAGVETAVADDPDAGDATASLGLKGASMTSVGGASIESAAADDADAGDSAAMAGGEARYDGGQWETSAGDDADDM
ncbi:S-adenosyl-L-methionine-dependent methyltransferase [Tribonema minus]|uniref:S-adenosyl-L-methionine-dependent methyltransferase n=1 Tax=Tribonema minus TaxID=303371 RepID=A0A836C9V0_9STRA|nr:S-adenosyl-L-methionine-dependent methyltransferase [Tribonema minus]